MSLTTEVRRRLGLITALFAALLVWWATITPPTFGPDEYKHVDLVRAVEQSWRYPAYDDRRVSHQMLEVLRTIPFDGNLTEQQAAPRAARPSLRDFGPDTPTARRNHIAAHPPAFYFVVAAPMVDRRDRHPSESATCCAQRGLRYRSATRPGTPQPRSARRLVGVP